MIIGTAVLTTVVAILIATPLGVGTAIYLREYTREGKVSRIIRFGTDCLAGVPSIIFGLFGFVFFVIFLRHGLVDPFRRTHPGDDDFADDHLYGGRSHQGHPLLLPGSELCPGGNPLADRRER